MLFSGSDTNRITFSPLRYFSAADLSELLVITFKLEFDLWAAIHAGNGSYGRYTLTQEEIDLLWSLSDECRSWIVFDEENEETAVDLEIWKEIFSRRENSAGKRR